MRSGLDVKWVLTIWVWGTLMARCCGGGGRIYDPQTSADYDRVIQLAEVEQYEDRISEEALRAAVRKALREKLVGRISEGGERLLELATRGWGNCPRYFFNDYEMMLYILGQFELRVDVSVRIGGADGNSRDGRVELVIRFPEEKGERWYDLIHGGVFLGFSITEIRIGQVCVPLDGSVPVNVSNICPPQFGYRITVDLDAKVWGERGMMK